MDAGLIRSVRVGHARHTRIRKRIAPVVASVGIALSLGWWQAAPALAATLTVTSTADSGAGTLRQAITDANGTAGPDTIDFSIAGPGPHVIQPLSTLPALNDVAVIDATGEALAGGAPGIVIDGSSAGSASGITLLDGSDGSQIRGLRIVDFALAGIYASDVTGVVIQGNYIGTDGTSEQGNTLTGITLVGSDGTSIEDNIVADSGGAGVLIDATSLGNQVVGNAIHDNAGLGIDLGASGVTANDVGDGDAGANDLQNFPVITGTGPSDVDFTLDSAPGTYRIEIYANASCDASGNGEGASLLKVLTGVAPGADGADVGPIEGTFLSATATNEATGDTSEFGPCFEVVDGLPAPGTWVGDEGSSGGTFMAAGIGAPAGPAQFTYTLEDALPDSGDGQSGEWQFYTTAAADGTIDVPWRYTGFHAFFGVTAGLEAWVVRDGDYEVSRVTLVAAGPANCCTAPSSGFDYSGDATFTVEAGDLYGFTLMGANGDSNETLRGELVLGTEVPVDCADAQDLYSATDDGRYLILPTGGQRFSVHCADMGATARDYLELSADRIGPSVNFSSYTAGGVSTGTTVTTSFSKLRFDPATLLVDIDDRTFSTSTGSLTHSSISDPHPVTSMPYATAMSCTADSDSNGVANVNLGGTAFAVDDTWSPVGTNPEAYGGATISSFDQVVDIFGNGFCGWRHPEPIGPLYVFDAHPDRYVLQLRYTNQPPVQVLATPVVFGSISRTSTTADLYARVDGAENDPLSIDVRTSTSCTNGVLDSPAVVATVAKTTDAEGYVLLDGVSGIASGDFVTITVTSPSATGASTCVRTTADNDYWPKALPLTSAGAQDVIDVAGKSRWYKVAVKPGQQIKVTVKNQPADYDLAVFKDIGKEFIDQLAPTTPTDLTKLSAEYAPSVFSPAVFSPAVFSPAVFSPDAYSPAVFSPAVFSPGRVLARPCSRPRCSRPAVFSPAVFSPARVLAGRVLARGLLAGRVLARGLLTGRVQPDRDRPGVLECTDPQHHRRVRHARDRRRDRGGQFLEQRRRLLHPCRRARRRVRPQRHILPRGHHDRHLLRGCRGHGHHPSSGRRRHRTQDDHPHGFVPARPWDDRRRDAPQQAQRLRRAARGGRPRRRCRQRRPGHRSPDAGQRHGQSRLPLCDEPRRGGDQGDRRFLSRQQPGPPVRRDRRRRQRHPVLPLPGPEPPWPGVRLRPARQMPRPCPRPAFGATTS